MWRDWVKDPPDKLVGGLILIKGVWLEPTSIEGIKSYVKAGDEFLAIALWTGDKEKGKDFGWYVQYSNTLASFNVAIKEWSDLYRGPK